MDGLGRDRRPSRSVVAGAHGGFFIVRAVAGALEASVDGRIVVEGPGPTTNSTELGVLRWSGAVPPHKWMNFYTKVVSRFPSLPGLKLNVTPDAPVAPDQTTSTSDETKMALKEPELTDDVS
jgi:hypothetical protein